MLAPEICLFSSFPALPAPTPYCQANESPPHSGSYLVLFASHSQEVYKYYSYLQNNTHRLSIYTINSLGTEWESFNLVTVLLTRLAEESW